MAKTFKLDGKSHAVEPDDIILIEGPGEYYGKITKERITLKCGETITFTCSDLAPGESVTIETNVFPPTTFFRSIGLSADEGQSVETITRTKKPAPA